MPCVAIGCQAKVWAGAGGDRHGQVRNDQGPRRRVDASRLRNNRGF